MAKPIAQRAGQPRRFSGFLVLSILFTVGYYVLGGFLYAVYAGRATLIMYKFEGILPLAGLVFAVLGFRAARSHPEVIGRKSAIACMVVAALATGQQIYSRVQQYPNMLAAQAMQSVEQPFFIALKNRNYEGLYQAMSPQFRKTHTAAAVKKMVSEAFPGTGDIQLSNKNTKMLSTIVQVSGGKPVRVDFGADKAEVKKRESEAMALQDDFAHEGRHREMTDGSTLRVTYGGKTSDFRLVLRLIKTDENKFTAEIADFEITPVKKEEKPEEKGAKKEESGSPAPKTKEAGKTGTAPEKPPAKKSSGK